MTADQLARYRQARADGGRPEQALAYARWQTQPPAWPWLTLTVDQPAIGTIDGLTIRVAAVPDDDSQLGEDDVTGWFTDRNDGTCLRNTHRDWGTDYAWYHPSTYDLHYADGRDAPKGTAKQPAREWAAARIRQAMADDAARRNYGVTVTVSLDGYKLGSASLWSIDTDDPRYLINVAEDLIPQALAAAREEMATLAASINRALATT